ncbi:sialate O-acetylesterase [Sphingomonas sp. LHG3406-1]|uniref:sialate O-acetylesterase n=1 Tax=Sphingomonas sp. LHG3406-1 TaxID=2804617 RepID=UPI00260B2DF9|nr:sialate O-acetylesterase [Sphingomonas sp. LHG3406-1]
MHSRPGLIVSSGVLALTLGTAAGAAPTIDVPYSNDAVIQRDRPVVVTGTARPGERVNLRVGGQAASVVADAGGLWSARFPALPAGGPYRIEVRDAEGASATAENVMVGDVWLCSGQSNMEYPLDRALNGAAEVEAATDPMLRLMTIPQRAIVAPAPLTPDVRWEVSSPATAASFSAACTFMARDLRSRDRQVPIGLIDASWGATPIRAWMDEAAVRGSGGAAEADLLALYRRDRAAGAVRFGEEWGAWWRRRSGDAVGREPWRASDSLTWQPMPAFTFWETWGRPDFERFNGGVWARKRIRLTASQAKNAATLGLGVIDDSDTTFVNGVTVGTTYSWSLPREYRLAPGTLKEGDNELLVFVRDNWAAGGFQGPAERVELRLANGEKVALGSGWEISVAPDRIGEPPLAPWDGQSGVGTLFSGMIAPLGPIGLKGVAWYQGEADVGKPGYDRRLAALMASWRRHFANERLPFLIVGLAGWGKPGTSPVESGWAALIDEQRRAVAVDRSAALVSAIDLGEKNDIHPPDKQEVGRRLALAALGLAYRSQDGRVGPVPVRAAREGETIRLRFSKALQALSGAPLGIELCGAGAGSCRFAAADIDGTDLLVRKALPGDVKVRHAWADSPVVNLYDADLLPVPVFELPIGQ